MRTYLQEDDAGMLFETEKDRQIAETQTTKNTEENHFSTQTKIEPSKQIENDTTDY